MLDVQGVRVQPSLPMTESSPCFMNTEVQKNSGQHLESYFMPFNEAERSQIARQQKISEKKIILTVKLQGTRIVRQGTTSRIPKPVAVVLGSLVFVSKFSPSAYP